MFCVLISFLFHLKNKKKETSFFLSNSFFDGKIKSFNRIGPHPDDVISTLVGNLLGDGWGEKRSNASRFHLHMSVNNFEYINSVKKFFEKRGYCSNLPLLVSKQTAKQGKIYYSARFRTYSFSSLNWLYDSFYIKGTKRVPLNIKELLTPRALSHWMMDDGGVSGSGCKISTDGFVYEDVERLRDALKERYGLNPTIQHHKANWVIYFKKESLPFLSKIIKPYMISSMHYKLNEK